MMASDVTLFPQPDSPTRPTVDPAGTSKVNPSTARNAFRPRVWNVTDRSVTESRAIRGLPPQLRVESFAQRVADEVEAQGGEDDGGPGDQGKLWRGGEQVLRVGEHPAPFGDARVGGPKAEVGQARRIDDRGGERQRRLDDHGRQGV